MASGSQARSGAYIGTGAALDVRTVCFRPCAVKLSSEAGDHAEWLAAMADDSMRKSNATGAGSFVTSDGVTPLSDGFSVGADADLNVVGEKVYWLALE